jgi:Cytochrome c554 and c-prime
MYFRDSKRRPGSRIMLCFALFVWGSELSAQSNSYVGALACGKCHAARLAGQSASAHAHALSLAAQHPMAAYFAPETELVRPPRFHFHFRRVGTELHVTVSDGGETSDLPIEWAFGAGNQAVTFVTRLDADWYLEHYFTYYSAIRGLAPTPGHQGYRSNTLALARGVGYRSVDPVSGIVKCFECHSTGPPHIGANREIQPAELGVRCEACHGPGKLHVGAASAGQLEQAKKLIQNPRRMSASGINQFCGNCHRAPQDGPLSNADKAWNVRHQPIYLAQSACFLKSKGTLSCLTCHDMHQELDRKPASYDQKCAACHKAVKHSPASRYAAARAASCVGCHMPRVSPQPHIEFTNHWIGVYSDESKLKPRRN